MRKLFGDETTLVEMEAFREDFLAEEEHAPGDVRVATLESLHLKLGQIFLYLFDYGDEWRFKVRLHSINENAPEDDYPKLVERVGESPPQYPDWE